MSQVVGFLYLLLLSCGYFGYSGHFGCLKPSIYSSYLDYVGFFGHMHFPLLHGCFLVHSTSPVLFSGCLMEATSEQRPHDPFRPREAFGDDAADQDAIDHDSFGTYADSAGQRSGSGGP